MGIMAQDTGKKDERKLFTPEKKIAFLAVLSASCNVSKACKAAGIERLTAYRHRESDPEFAQQWEEAKDLGAEMLEDVAVKRATKGTLRPVFYKGEECGVVREYSNTLLIFLLKGAKPDKYADRQKTELSNPDGTFGPDDTTIANRLEAIMHAAQQRKAADENGEGPGGDGSELF